MTGEDVAVERLLEAVSPTGESAAVGVIEDGVVELARSEDVGPFARFEFGSITKTMTAQVLASLALDGTVSLDDPIGRWLDAGRNDGITLGEIAQHRSGLPRMAPNAEDGDGFDQLDPYASYTEDLAEAALREAQPDPERFPLYSNFGYQLLGIAVERAARQPLQHLLHEHVFDPFGLATASLGPHPKLIQGMLGGEPTPPWQILLPGPGGVVGTIDDLLAWGAAALNPPKGRAGDALTLATRPHHDGVPVGLGWQLHDELIWHNGGTFGFHACLAVSRDRNRVAASLIATSDLDHVDDATRFAAKGRDRQDARPQPAGPEHNRAALTLVEALAAHDWEKARVPMTAGCRQALTAARLGDAWRHVMAPRGDHRSSEIRHTHRKGAVVGVTIDLRFAEGTGWAKVTFNEDSQVVGLLIG